MVAECAAAMASSRPSRDTAHTETRHPTTAFDHSANTSSTPHAFLPPSTLSLLHMNFSPFFDKPHPILVHSSLVSDENLHSHRSRRQPQRQRGSSTSPPDRVENREPQAHSAPSLTFTLPHRKGPRPPALPRSPLPLWAASMHHGKRLTPQPVFDYERRLGRA